MKPFLLLLSITMFTLFIASCNEIPTKDVNDKVGVEINTITDKPTPSPEKLNSEPLVEKNSDCNPSFKIEGINDAKGIYKNENESWTIHFSDDKFIAFHTKNDKQSQVLPVSKIEARSNCEYGILMQDIQGEMVPSWTLIYNVETKVYDLHAHEYDAGEDIWSDKIYLGSNDNG